MFARVLEKIDDICGILPIEDIIITDNIDTIRAKLLKGRAILQMKEKDQTGALNYRRAKSGVC
ncbi:hypothetical protein [Ammoniphilus sp. CFH 90114]|uniref:hypothetical protein n=1 Tax=Ammoniphilus sp. CFH 90114 TaxID=2493665 RepID=UPI00100FB932|nr:hypothetical protein [Ammoniphilus sp. CFH 90114]RXT06953.1 hypothetical protein EIZ39_12370 [Ammoniphilus sp. CFH 90114]